MLKNLIHQVISHFALHTNADPVFDHSSQGVIETCTEVIYILRMLNRGLGVNAVFGPLDIVVEYHVAWQRLREFSLAKRTKESLGSFIDTGIWAPGFIHKLGSVWTFHVLV